MPPAPSIEPRTSSLGPTADLHVHLEAAIRAERLVEFAAREGVSLPPGFGPAGFDWSDLATFVRDYDLLCQVIRTAESYATVAYDYLEDAAASGALYVDFIVSPAHGWINRIAYADLVDALGEAMERARAKFGVLSSLSLTAVRAPGPHFGSTNAERLVAEACANPRPWVRGFGVAGDTRFDDLGSYARAFRQARECGLVTRAHCGEGEGAHAVLTALDTLEVQLLDHATDGLRDREVCARLIDEQRTVTVCPMAHVLVGVVPSLKEHPAWHAHRQGLRLALGTDDPVFFGVSLRQTYALVQDELGLGTSDMLAITRNALCSGLLDPEERDLGLAMLQG